MMRSSAVALAAFFAVSLTALAQDKKGPLAELPSKPGPHIEKIKAMGDNQWLSLGAPAADPKWGKARGSSWGAKALILAADKRGAFLFGEGVHGYVKPDGHSMDDLWFYNINNHAWICLYPGMNTKTFTQRVKDKQLVIDDDGQLIDNEKQPTPLHTLVHAWGYLTYDSDRQKFAFVSWGNNPIPRYFGSSAFRCKTRGFRGFPRWQEFSMVDSWNGRPAERAAELVARDGHGQHHHVDRGQKVYQFRGQDLGQKRLRGEVDVQHG